MTLKEYLKKNGIVCKWFADQIGVSYGTLHTIFKGGGATKPVARLIQELTHGEIRAEDLVKSKKPTDLAKKG